MEKLFSYPTNGWQSHSKRSPASLATLIHKLAFDFEIEAHLSNVATPSMVGWDKSIQSTSFNIKFIEQDYGCSVQVYIFAEDINSMRFQQIWKTLVDEGIVWGGPYKKSLNKEPVKPIDDPKEESKPGRVDQKHLAIWKIIKPLSENGTATYIDMKKAIEAKTRKPISVNTIKNVIKEFEDLKKIDKSD